MILVEDLVKGDLVKWRKTQVFVRSVESDRVVVSKQETGPYVFSIPFYSPKFTDMQNRVEMVRHHVTIQNPSLPWEPCKGENCECNQPHNTSPLQCYTCGFTWQAVYPSNVAVLYCPKCNRPNMPNYDIPNGGKQ
jgi:hypothetical protein